MGIDELADEIRALLERFEGEGTMKRLFWDVLSYDRVREPLPRSLLPPSTIGLVSTYEIFAASESLAVVYVEAKQLPPGWQLEQIAWATKRHFLRCVLVLNYVTGWAMVYPDEVTARHVRFLQLPGPMNRVEETARALLALNAFDDSGESLTTLQQSEQLDAFFPGVVPNLSDIFDDFDRIAKHKDSEVQELRPLLRGISAYPLLTAKQERGEDIWGAGVPSEGQLRFHQERLVLHNLRLVVWMALKVRRMGITLSDLIQEGSIGLMTAARRFDLERGNRFTTYAFHWVRQAMYRALHNQCNLIRWPVWIAPKLIEAAREKRFEGLSAGEKPPLFVPCRLDVATFYEVDQCLPVIQSEIAERVDSVLQELRPRECDILGWRFGLHGEEQTLEAIGDCLGGLTRERVRQIEARALRRLRHPVRQQRFTACYELSRWLEFSAYDDGANGRDRAPLRNYVALREGF